MEELIISCYGEAEGYLIVADYCEERGDMQTAELLRQQMTIYYPMYKESLDYLYKEKMEYFNKLNEDNKLKYLQENKKEIKFMEYLQKNSSEKLLVQIFLSEKRKNLLSFAFWKNIQTAKQYKKLCLLFGYKYLAEQWQQKINYYKGKV